MSKRHFLSDPLLQIETLIKLYDIRHVIDVGANQGQFASHLLTMPSFNGQILSFEPEKISHENLVKKASKISNWKVGNRVAVGDENGDVELNVAGNSVSSSILKVNQKHVESAPHSRTVETQKVRIVRLEDEIEEFDNTMSNIYLKVDVQGFELEVLRGATKLFEKTSVIQLEVSLVSLYEGQADWIEIHQYMNNNKFRLWGIQNGFHDKTTGQQLQIDLIYVQKK